MSKLKQCKVCSKQIASNAKSCPECGAKHKKPLYQRPWFIIVAFLVIVGAIGGSNDGGSTTTDNLTAGVEQDVSQNETTETDVPVEKVEEDIPTEYKSALKKAETYSKTMNMSKDGIYEQLTSEYGEKFTAEAAQYAIDNMVADWKQNALKKAETYQNTMSMSPSAIYDQLVSAYGEKFTAEEAQYAIDNLK